MKRTIRQWEDMAAQFGVYPCGSIKCRHSFTRNMKSLCGREIEYTGTGTRVDSWAISEDMLEPIKNKTMTKFTAYGEAPIEKKKTVFTEVVTHGSWTLACSQPSNFTHVQYMGRKGGQHYFIAWNSIDSILHYRGIPGDEFNIVE